MIQVALTQIIHNILHIENDGYSHGQIFTDTCIRFLLRMTLYADIIIKFFLRSLKIRKIIISLIIAFLIIFSPENNPHPRSEFLFSLGEIISVPGKRGLFTLIRILCHFQKMLQLFLIFYTAEAYSSQVFVHCIHLLRIRLSTFPRTFPQMWIKLTI